MASSWSSRTVWAWIDHGAATVAGVGAVGLSDNAEELVGSGVAVAVGDDLPALPVGFLGTFHRLLVGHRRVAAVVGRGAVRRDVVRLRQPGGLALRRAIEDELDAAVLEASDVVARTATPQHLSRGRPVGVTHNIEEEATVGGGSLELRLLEREHCAFLGGGDTGGGVDALRLGEGGRLGVRAGWRDHAGAEEAQRRLLKEACGLATFLAADHASRRVRRFGGDAGALEGRGVGDSEMARDVRYVDWSAGGRAVEVVAGGMTPFGHEGRVIAAADDPVAVGGVVVGEALEFGDEAVDIVHRPDRWRGQVGETEARSDLGQVAVAIDETGEHRMVAELRNGGIRAAQGENVALSSRREHAAAGDSHGFHAWIVGLHREDRTAREDPVGERAVSHTWRLYARVSRSGSRPPPRLGVSGKSAETRCEIPVD